MPFFDPGFFDTEGAVTGRDLVTTAARELGYLDLVETLEAEVAVFLLDKVNRIIDLWNAERDAVYADIFRGFTLTQNLTPHTIGPTGTWVTAQRPVTIDGAKILVGGTAWTPLRLEDRDDWFRRSTPDLATSLPTSLYYDATWPNGTLYFAPVPTAALDVVLMTRVVLTMLTLDTVVSLPPAYQEALTLTLAEESAGPLAVALTPKLERSAAHARATLQANNRRTPTIDACDAGIPGGRSGIHYDYRSGQWR